MTSLLISLSSKKELDDNIITIDDDDDDDDDNDDDDDDDDDDNETTTSIETLLSEWSDSYSTSDENDEVRVNNNTKSEKKKLLKKRRQLVKNFRFRDKLLERMSTSSSSTSRNKFYVNVLRQNEALVRAEAFRFLEGRKGGIKKKWIKKEEGIKTPKDTRTSTNDKNESDTDTTNINKLTNENNDKQAKNNKKKDDSNFEKREKNYDLSPSSSFFTAWKNHIIFELCVVFPGFIIIFFYCTASMSIYELMHSSITEQLRYISFHEDYLYLGVIMMAFFLLRVSGGIWDYCSTRQYEIAKFELHNRIRLKYTDAKIHRWFRNHPMIKLIVSYFCLYFCLICFSYFQHRLLAPVFANRDWVLQKLPSRAAHHQKIGDTPAWLWIRGLTRSPCDSPLNKEELEQCQYMNALEEEDHRMLRKTISLSSCYSLVGSANAHVMRPLAHLGTQLVISCVSMLMLYILGFMGTQ